MEILRHPIQTIRRVVGEQVTSIRSSWGAMRRTFWPSPAFTTKKVNYAVTRNLYRNDGKEVSLGAGFARPIIDLQTEFIGLPYASSGDSEFDEFLNDAIQNYWAPELLKIWRDACRDSLAIVRIRRKPVNNLLVTQDEANACYLEIVAPERTQIFYSREDQTLIERAVIVHEIESLDTDEHKRAQRRTGRLTGSKLFPVRREVIVEEITPETYKYFNETTGRWEEEWEEENDWGFVPVLEIHNEYDETIEGGYSDLESAYPFIKAFHEVFAQALAAHKSHSIPKAKFKLHDVEPFLMNNFADSFEQDEQGNPVAGTFDGDVSWKGTEIFFMKVEEEVEFLEAKSVLGDSKTLLDFIFDCICIASETPAEAFMRPGLDRQATKGNFMPFTRKMWRKRVNFAPYVQRIVKMVLVVNRLQPETVPMTWQEFNPQDIIDRAQALQMTTAALEIGVERQWIADDSAARHLARHIPEMGAIDEEMAKAKKNLVLAAPTAPNSTRTSPNGNKPATATGRPVGGRNE